MMVKLSEDVIAKFGATNAADFNAKLLAFVGSCEEAMQAQTSLSGQISALQNDIKGMGEKLKAASDISAQLTTLTEKVNAVNPEALLAKAEEAGSRAAAKNLGKVGATGAAATETNPNEGTTAEAPKDFRAIVSALVAGGKSKAEAVMAAIASNPKEYTAARAAGDITL